MVGRWIPQEQGSYSQCEKPSGFKVSQVWEVAIVNGSQGRGDPKRERDRVIKSNVEASGTWVPMGCSQEWLLVGRGRRDCPAKVCTILIEGLQGRGESLLGYPSLLPPPTKKKHQHVAPISLGDGDCVGELLGGKRWDTRPGL